MDSDEPMVHLTDGPDDVVAICGARLLGVDAPAGAPIDCVVCVELNGGPL